MGLLLPLVLVTYFVCMVDRSGASWWSLGATKCAKRPPGAACEDCDMLQAESILTTTQKEICEYDKAPVQEMAKGIREAILDCQRRFACSKWTCATFIGENLFGAFVVQNHTRETAVLHALLTAGAVHAVAEACHKRRILDCPCVIDDSETWDDYVTESPVAVLEHYDNLTSINRDNLTIWNNQSNSTSWGDQSSTTVEELTFTECAAHMEWALDFVLEFVSPLHTLDRQNMEYGGHLMTTSSLTRSCACHGLSGSCTVKTCYQRALHISEAGEILMKSYKEAPDLNSDPNNLVFDANSPDFCSPDIERGVLGTADRRCDPTSSDTHSCNALCCGRGLYVLTVTGNVMEVGMCCDGGSCGAVRINPSEYLEVRCK